MTEPVQQLVPDLQTRARQNGCAFLVIDGDCAAGKTTLAEQIAARLDCNVFHMDDFFLPPDPRTETRLQEPGGNIHYERFLVQVLTPLPHNKPFRYDVYSCVDNATHPVSVTPKPVSIIEGSYALHPQFLPSYHAMNAMKAFMSISPEEQLRRIRKRNSEAMLRRFWDEWIPMEKRYHQAYQELWGNVLFISVS